MGFSGRFDGGDTERLIRAAAALTPKDVNPYVVGAQVGDEFGPMTMEGLARSYAMVAFVSKHPPYGEKTISPYCSYYELKYWLDHREEVRLIAIQLDSEFPPRTGEKAG